MGAMMTSEPGDRMDSGDGRAASIKRDLHALKAEPMRPLTLREHAALAARRLGNRYRLVRGYDRVGLEPDGFPAHLKIELTNYCNLRCTHCPYEKMKRPIGYMPPTLFKAIVDEAAPLVEFCYLHHFGESLFHPGLFDYVRYGVSKGLRLGLSTNATVLTERTARLLLTSGLQFLVLSLDGASAATYEAIRKRADWERTIANVRRFFELKKSIPNSLHAVVQMIQMAETEAEVEAFSRTWNDQHIMIKKAKDWAGQIPHLTKSKPEQAHACPFPWTEMTILWDGRVTLCANMYEAVNLVGDLRKQSICEVWRGEGYQRIRKIHREGRIDQLPICRTCSVPFLDRAQFLSMDQFRVRTVRYGGHTTKTREGLSN